MKIKEIKKELKELIPEKRYKHTLGVVESATDLAEVYKVNKKKAKVAALLHDSAKGMSIDEMLHLAKKNNYKLSKSVLNNPGVIHAFVGPIVAKKKFGIDDPEIASAIRNHTTGAPGMNTLDKIIFLADYIEPGRTTPGVEDVRKLAYKDLNEAVLLCLDRTINYLIQKNRPIEITTIETRNSILKEINKENG